MAALLERLDAAKQDQAEATRQANKKKAKEESAAAKRDIAAAMVKVNAAAP